MGSLQMGGRVMIAIYPLPGFDDGAAGRTQPCPRSQSPKRDTRGIVETPHPERSEGPTLPGLGTNQRPDPAILGLSIQSAGASSPSTSLDLTLPIECEPRAGSLLKVNQAVDMILLSKAGNQAEPVLVNAADQVSGDPGVKHPRIACQDVHIEPVAAHGQNAASAPSTHLQLILGPSLRSG
jgi:hypothetical protein